MNSSVTKWGEGIDANTLVFKGKVDGERFTYISNLTARIDENCPGLIHFQFQE